MKLLVPLLVVASLPLAVSVAQTPGTGAPLSAASQEATAASDAGVQVEFEYATGHITLGPAPLARLELRKAGESHLIAFGEWSQPVTEALFLRFPARQAGSAKKAWIVLLHGGDMLRAGIARGPGGSAAQDEDSLGLLAEGLGAAVIDVPLAQITALIAETALYGRPGRLLDYAQARAQLVRHLRGMEVDEDVVLLRRDPRASGSQGSRIDGIVEKLTDGGLTISSERLGAVEVSYDRLKALVLAQLEADGDADAGPGGGAAVEPAALQVHVRLRDGGHLAGRLVSLESGRARLEHGILGGLDVDLDHVAEIAFLGGRVSYLSDREPINVREYPGPLFNESERYRYKRDTNALFGPLRMSGRIFRKGLGVHSYSLLEYALAPDDARFQATIGLDDSARPFSDTVAASDVATVVFRVKVDGNKLFEKEMSWQDAPVPIEVAIKGTRLSLEVDFGGVEGSMNSTLDRANWADARLVKNPE